MVSGSARVVANDSGGEGGKSRVRGSSMVDDSQGGSGASAPVRLIQKRSRRTMVVHGYCLPRRNDRSALFIKLSWKCGSALEQTSSDSRLTGVLRFGVFHG